MNSIVSPSRDRVLARQVVVRRLLALDEPGKLASVHVRIAADTAGVCVRTVWRWLAVARASGCAETTSLRRGGFAFTNELWAQLSDLGGNVAALHRQLHVPYMAPAMSEIGLGRGGGFPVWGRALA
ncbi:hypothetical protein [Streptomyces sp. NPDC057909]|uniref:hypothetical protein n=1 Tax=Streptomyces sp. NPDC057909 TaxID=3346277 RepID=UPI0036E4E941